MNLGMDIAHIQMYFSNSNQLKGYSIHSHTIYSIESCSEGIYADLYRTCSVPAPYRLRVEVSLSGECTEQVRFRQLPDM